jgi:hypothetical protein
MLPTFIIVGTPKSGTTALYDFLKAHPEVCLSMIRDPNYFCDHVGVYDSGHSDDDQNNGLAFSGNFHKGLEWYEGLYQHCGAARAIGEVSRDYFVASTAPQLIKNVIPNVQLIFTLRDPVARLYSHYWQERKHGWELPGFHELVELRHPRFTHYLSTSSYQVHLKRYQELFPREQISVVLFEDLVQDPLAFIQNIYQQIRVDPGFVPPNLDKQYNPPRLPRIKWIQRFLVRLAEVRLKLGSLGWLYDRLSWIGRGIMDLNSVIAPYPPLSPGLRFKLIGELEEAIDYVENTLKRPLPLWREVE